MNAIRTGPELLERDDELRALEQLLDRASDGSGSLVVVEGAPGVGKTTLLHAAASLAADRGFAVLVAAGVELERAFAWGVARQLFERRLTLMDAEDRAEALTGVASLADDLILSPSVPADAAQDPFAALHALYWLTANLAGGGPLLLAVDDAQWSDEPSVRLLAYLTARVADLPVVLLVASRPPDRASTTLRALVRDPSARRLLPAPLSRAAVAVRLAAGLGSEPAETFADACHEATRGNPFLVDTLVESLLETGTEPTAEGAAHARELGSRTLSEIVVHRMLRLGEDPQRLVHAIAVLAPEADLHLAAGLAGMSQAAATAAVDALAAEHVLAHERPLRFVHPLVQSAVTEATPPGERDELHARAAELLRDAGAPLERVAGHWLRAAPGARPAALRDLREAARIAGARGAPDAGARFLRRALEEPLGDAARAALIGELGVVELQLGSALGERHVRQAMAAAPDGITYARLVRELRTAFFNSCRDAEAVELTRDALARLGDADPELRLALRADEINATRFGYGRSADLGDALTLAGETPGERRLLAAVALERTLGGGTADEVAELAARALASDTLIEEDDENIHGAMLVEALLAVDRVEEAARLSRAGLNKARRMSLRSPAVTFSWTQAHVAHRAGDLPAATADAERALAGAEELRVPTLIWRVGSTFVAALVDRGRLADARAALARIGDENLPVQTRANWLRFQRARLRLADGDAPGAIMDLEELLATDGAWMSANPAVVPLRSTLAGALLLTGDVQGAREHADAELDAARQWGGQTAIGVAQRARALCERGDAAVDRLRAAVETLSSSPSALERARALAELGAAIRRAGQRTAAREPLREALDLAARCGADGLAEWIREELRAAGSRPRRAALGGVEALTASELRVARLAAEGMTNREIAQALFVTSSTVEVHLTRIYRKLSISTRADLPAAMATAA